MKTPLSIIFRHGDIPEDLGARIRAAKVVAWDIETSGLDWKQNQIATCQLCIPNELVVVIAVGSTVPLQLLSLLSDNSVKKIFHHALFDLRFMTRAWRANPHNIADTKIAAKLLYGPNESDTSLKALLERHLGIHIDKTQQTSNWLAPELTKPQLQYAASDVLYLPLLLSVIERQLKTKGLLQLERACFAHIPTRVQLDLLGYPDMYVH